MDVVTLSKLPQEDVVKLQNSSKIANSLEDQWMRKVSQALEKMVPEILDHLEKTGKPPEINIEDLMAEHFFSVSITAMRYAETEVEVESRAKPGSTQLARFPKVKIPKTLEALMKLYDLWKKKKFMPKRAKKQAIAIQKEYLNRVNSVWEKHSRPFRSGDIATQEEVTRQIKEAASTTVSRSKTIVRTETTNYYNDARKQFYDQSVDITHYLFIAIRDAATSPWCSPNTQNGYRGRSGLVYAKSDPLCDKERPACHWNCRSEYLPLNRLNPAHLRFIQNLSIQRRENRCYPLPNNWHAA